MHACWITSVTIFHHAFQILHILCQMRVWITRYRGRSPWFNSSSVHCFKSKFLTMHIFRGSSSISCNQIPQYQWPWRLDIHASNMKREDFCFHSCILSCNSRSSEVFIGWVVNLSPVVTWYFCSIFLHAICSYMLCMHAELHQSPYFIMHFKFFILYVECVYELQDIWGDLHDSTLKCALPQKQIPHYAHLQGEFFYILQSNSSI